MAGGLVVRIVDSLDQPTFDQGIDMALHRLAGVTETAADLRHRGRRGCAHDGGENLAGKAEQIVAVEPRQHRVEPAATT